MLKNAFGLLGVFLVCAAAGANDDEKAKAEQQAKRRLELMQAVVTDLKAASSEITAASALKLGKTPLLRYDDPTRGLSVESQGLVDGGVWRVGESGRPTALITLEIYRTSPQTAVLGQEFVSLSSARFELTPPRGVKWTPQATDLAMVPLPGAPAAAETPRARLTQMRQLARRFSVSEELGKDKIECRLLSQPIDRYSDPDAKIQDGALFVFANGTNPELGLLLECTGKEWSYGVFRLTSAAVVARLDDKQFFEAQKIGKYSPTAPYMGFAQPIPPPE